MLPTLNLTKPLSAFWANAGVRNSSGPSRPNAAAAVAADMTKPRREMLCMMSSLDTCIELPERPPAYARIEGTGATQPQCHAFVMLYDRRLTVAPADDVGGNARKIQQQAHQIASRTAGIAVLPVSLSGGHRTRGQQGQSPPTKPAHKIHILH